MKIVLQIFTAVMYLHCAASSYRHHGFNNSPKTFNLGMLGSSDYSNFGKMHRKRYSGFGKNMLIRGANDLLNSYFKIGSFPIIYDVDPSVDLRPRATLVGNAIKPKTQSTPSKKVVKAEKAAQARTVPDTPPEPVVAKQSKPAVPEPKPVKRPVIIFGHIRGAGMREQMLRRFVVPTPHNSNT